MISEKGASHKLRGPFFRISYEEKEVRFNGEDRSLGVKNTKALFRYRFAKIKAFPRAKKLETGRQI